MIKVQVDWNRCQHYGQCAFEAPEVFRLNDADQLEHEGTADDSQLSNIEAAVDVCPMQAISIVE
jgi:ferredoxin